MIGLPNCRRSLRVGDRRVERGLRQPDRAGGDAEPAAVQRGHGDAEPLPLRAEQPVGRHAGAVEDDLGGQAGPQTHLALGRCRGTSPGVSAGASRQEIPRGPSSAGAHHQVVEVRDAAVGDPRLRPVDDVVVAVADRPGASARRRPSRSCGSDRQYAPSRSPPSRSGSHCSRCSSVPYAASGKHGQRVHADAQADRQPGPAELLDDLQVDLVGLRRRRRAPPGRAARAGPPCPACGSTSRGNVAVASPSAARGASSPVGEVPGRARAAPRPRRWAAVRTTGMGQASRTTSSRGTRLSRSTPSSVHDDDVLDAGAVPAGQVDARLDAERHARAPPARSLPATILRLLVLLEADAVTGAVDEVLAVPRLGDDVARRRVDALGGDARPDRRRTTRPGRAQHLVVRRRSRPAARRGRRCGCCREQYPSAVVPPMSTTTGSPRLQHPRSRCRGAGWLPFGPEPTMTKFTDSWPSSTIASRDRAAGLALGPPDPQELPHPGVHPVDGLPGRGAQRLDLLGRLAHPQLAQHRPAGTCSAPGSAARKRSTFSAHIRLASPTAAGRRRGAAGDQRVRVLGLAPVGDLDAQAAGRRARRPGASSVGTTSTGSPVAGSTRQVSRSSGSASYPVR